MSPFGRKDQGNNSDAAVAAEFDRLNGLGLQQLGAEVLEKGFGPTCPADDGLVTPSMIAEVFAPGVNRASAEQVEAFHDLVWEGIQVVEHASLVHFAVFSSEGGKFFKLTRLGRAALEKNGVDRVLARGSL